MAAVSLRKCHKCNGEKTLAFLCEHCRDSGKVWDFVCPMKCENTFDSEKPKICNKCNGAGHVPLLCATCNDLGLIHYHGEGEISPITKAAIENAGNTLIRQKAQCCEVTVCPKRCAAVINGGFTS